MNPWLQILAAGGVGGIIVTVINVAANRRNLGSVTLRTDSERHRTDAETDELIRSTYGGMLADVERKNRDLAERLDRVEAKSSAQASTIALMISDRDDLLRWINGVLRPWIVSGAKPPAPAVPDHLADVLPQWVPVKNDDPEPT